MSASANRERRDPVSPLLGLGAALTHARRGALSGRLEVRDRGRSHEVFLAGGSIREVLLDGAAPVSGADDLEARATWLFALPRPHAIWLPGGTSAASARVVNPEPVVFGGVIARAELFEPRLLAERIPATHLSLANDRLENIRRVVLLSAAEARFLEGLSRPTPIPMLLWKRGLDPRLAGALLVALNLVGAFAEQWKPGVLPRITTAARVLRLMRSGAADHRLLGLPEDADPAAVERAFGALCLELHPDRLRGVPAAEVELAVEAFQALVAARDRLRRTRRSRPVRSANGEPLARVTVASRPATNCPEALADEARACLARKEQGRAAAFALKALALDPPDRLRLELAAIVSAARAA